MKDAELDGLQIIAFDSAKKWRAWLDKNHGSPEGIWLKFYKKGSGLKTVTYAEALDEALCYGWIDGQSKTFDEKAYLQKFTPRRARSIWSKRNTEHIERLTEERKMMPAGLEQVEFAKADGRWAKAYESPRNMVMPNDFLKELAKDKKATAFFKTLNKTNTYAIAWNLHNAKRPETRERRMKKYIDMMKNGEKLY